MMFLINVFKLDIIDVFLVLAKQQHTKSYLMLRKLQSINILIDWITLEYPLNI